MVVNTQIDGEILDLIKSSEDLICLKSTLSLSHIPVLKNTLIHKLMEILK
jgi:hypothetical protein